MNRKRMSDTDQRADGDLRPEYDLRALRVRRLGPARKQFGSVIRLDPDVVRVFPDAEAVNEALRFLIRVARERDSDSAEPAVAAG
jgi:hypothetical protein